MFEINLIRARIVPAKQKNIMAGLRYSYVFLWILSVVALVFLLIANVRKIGVYEGKLARIEQEISLTGSGLMTTEELKNVWSRLLRELKGIDYLLEGQIAWAPKLDRISQYLPDEVWIERIHSGGDDAGGTSGVKDQKKTSTPKKPEQKILVIEGRLLSGGAEAAAEVAEVFIARLKEDVLFMDGVDKITLAATKDEGGRTRRRATFRVECVFEKVKGFYE